MSFPSTIPDGLILGCPGITVGDDLPPSFSVAGSHLEIMYELVVTVMRSGSLRPDRMYGKFLLFALRISDSAVDYQPLSHILPVLDQRLCQRSARLHMKKIHHLLVQNWMRRDGKSSVHSQCEVLPLGPTTWMCSVQYVCSLRLTYDFMTKLYRSLLLHP